MDNYATQFGTEFEIIIRDIVSKEKILETLMSIFGIKKEELRDRLNDGLDNSSLLYEIFPHATHKETLIRLDFMNEKFKSYVYKDSNLKIAEKLAAFLDTEVITATHDPVATNVPHWVSYNPQGEQKDVKEDIDKNGDMYFI